MPSRESTRQGGVRIYATSGLDGDARSALRSMMDVLRGRTRSEWVGGDAGNADLLFLGAQGEIGDGEVTAHVRHVVRVSRTGAGKAGFAMQMDYPFRVFQLLSVLQEVEQEREDTADNPRLVTPDGQPSWALFDALHALSVHEARGAWLATVDGSLFVRDDLRLLAASPETLAAIQRGELPQSGLIAGATPPESLPRQDTALLLWQAGLHAGRGQLSGTLDGATHYRLTAWPDFGRLPAEPAHFRLSALLAAEAFRPDELLARLGDRSAAAAQRVNRFLNACAASGLLRIESPTRALPAAATPTPQRSFVGGLVSALRQRLGFPSAGGQER